MNLRPITVAEMREHAGDLLRAHWAEVGQRKHLRVLDPDWSKYELLEERGQLLAIGLHADNGRLVGYSVSTVGPHHNYQGHVVCQNLVLFVDAEHRRQSAGMRLMAATRNEARARGAREVIWHAKPDTALAAILARTCQVTDIVYSEEL